MRSHRLRAAAGNSSGSWFVDWGGGLPVWDTQTGYVVYQNISNPSMTGLDIVWNDHYGMTTDSYHRYLIFTNRNTNSNYTIWVPLVGTAGGGVGSVYPDFSARFGTMNAYGNYFGGLADTVRGRMYMTEYAQGYLIGQDLPSTLTNVPAGAYTSGSSISGGTTYTLANESGLFLDSSGNRGYWSGLANQGPCDGGYHDVQNDIYYFVGRNANDVRYYDVVAGTWHWGNNVTTVPLVSGRYHGICGDPSSNYFVYSLRNQGFYMSNGINGNTITTYGTGGSDSYGNPLGNHSYVSGTMCSSVEDVVIGWNGDIFAWCSGSQQLYQFTRTA